MAPRKHQELLTAAIERDGAAQAALLAGERDAAHAAFAEAAALYRQSWEAAPPSAYGRLVGLLKSTVLAGADGAAEARYVESALAGAAPESPTASYARALAALILDEDDDAARWARRMVSGGDAFARAGQAIAALAARDEGRFAAALGEIVRDFEGRAEHLTGVAIADTAVMLAELARRRGMAAAMKGPVLPR